MTGFKVYEAIAMVTAAMSVEGISKSNRNQQQGYSFRGIDDVFNALSPMLAKHKLCILPRVLSRSCIERMNQKGNALFYVTVESEFDFVSAEDGSKHTVKTFGEAMDSADKATNKAMSAAYKYAAMQAFCIPTEGDNDADATTHEVKAEPAPVSAAPTQTSAAEKKRQLVQIDDDLLDCHTENDVRKVAAHWQGVAKNEGWNADFKTAAKAKFDKRREELSNVVDDIAETFPGARVVAEQINSNLMAG